MTLNFEETQHAARAERDLLLAEKDTSYQREILLAREKQLAENERELTRLTANYDSRIASLDVRLESVGAKKSNNFRRIRSDRQTLSHLRYLLHGVIS
jgi:acetolactate synthase small subunit